jgi:hypothetical protein
MIFKIEAASEQGYWLQNYDRNFLFHPPTSYQVVITDFTE